MITMSTDSTEVSQYTDGEGWAVEERVPVADGVARERVLDIFGDGESITVTAAAALELGRALVRIAGDDAWVAPAVARHDREARAFAALKEIAAGLRPESDIEAIARDLAGD